MTVSPRRAPLRLAFSRDAAPPPDPDRFRLLVLPHLDAAYSYARYLARDPVAAEDVVQEAFLRAYRGYPGCRGNEKAWLLTIVRNCFIDWAKANGRPTPEASAEEAADPEDPAMILQRRQDQATVRATIEALPEPFRETLVLRELEELSYKDIAGLTAAPIGTVMSRLARARTMLATMLLARESEGGTER